MSTKTDLKNDAPDKSIEEIFGPLPNIVGVVRKTSSEIDSTPIPVVWTHESVCREASKYTTIDQFFEGGSDNGAYRYARSNNLMKECALSMTGGQSVKLMNKVKVSKTRAISLDLCSYFPKIAKPNRVLDETDTGPVGLASDSMSRDVCIEKASEFDDTIEWEAADPTSYATAERNGWMSSCVKHMTPEAKNDKYLAMVMPAIIKAADNLIKKGSNGSINGLTWEDLRSEGILAALEKIHEYKNAQASFLGYTKNRITGGMIDSIRNGCPVPRSQMDKLKELNILTEEPETKGWFGMQIKAREATKAGGKVDSAKVRSRKEAASMCALGALSPVYLDAPTGDDGQTMAHEIVGMDETELSNQTNMLSLKLLIEKMASVGGSGFGSNLSDRGITEKEYGILKMIQAGYDTQKIAEIEEISENRVSQIISKVVLKMQYFIAADEFYVA